MSTHDTYKISTNIIITTIIGFLGFLLNYILNIFLARHFSAAYYGDFSIAIKILFLGSTFMLLGTDISANRFFSTYLHREQQKKVSAYLHWNLVFISRAFLISIVLGLTLFFIMTFFHHMGWKDFASYHLAVYMLWITPLAGMTFLYYSYLIAGGKNKVSTFIVKIGRSLLFFSFFFIALVFLNTPVTDFLVIIVISLSLFIMITIQAWFLRKKLGSLFFTSITSSVKASKADATEWKKVALRLAFISIIYLIISTTDLLIVEIISPNEPDVGYYAAILIISSFIFIFSVAAYQTISPIVARSLATPQGVKDLKSKLRITNCLFFILNIPTVFILIIFGRTFLAHFGQQYLHIDNVLNVSIAAMFILSCAAAPAMLLINGGGEKVLNFIYMCQLALLIIFGTTFTYFFGIMGMAIATLIAASAKTILSLVMVRRKLHIKALTFI